ncbi:MAG: CheR family methyltransferase [Acidobacteriota bacterium]
MKDASCVAFLQWALPRLGFRWPGFRKVRRQVCRRIRRRYAALGLADLAAYRRYLETDPDELAHLDACFRVTLSRFYRDRRIFERLGDEILPGLARNRDRLRVWSAGCASGEEPYSVALVWRQRVRMPEVELEILATDADAHMLERAARAVYSEGTLRELPQSWRETAFRERADELELLPAWRELVEFRQQDLRTEMPAGPFDLVLCRNLAFMYFDQDRQLDVLRRLATRIRSGGWLVIGNHESLPSPATEFAPDGPCSYRRV